MNLTIGLNSVEMKNIY